MPVRIAYSPPEDSDDALSERYGLDKRTVHLLPQKCPEYPTPTPVPSTHRLPIHPHYDPEYQQAWQRMSAHFGNGSSSNSNQKWATTPYWRRYAAILKKNGIKYFAKVVIQEDLGPWAKKRGFDVLREFRMYGTVNEKMEKTEFSKSGSK